MLSCPKKNGNKKISAMSSAYWISISYIYVDLFYTPKSLPCCRKKILLIAFEAMI